MYLRVEGFLCLRGFFDLLCLICFSKYLFAHFSLRYIEKALPCFFRRLMAVLFFFAL